MNPTKNFIAVKLCRVNVEATHYHGLIRKTEKAAITGISVVATEAAKGYVSVRSGLFLSGHFLINRGCQARVFPEHGCE